MCCCDTRTHRRVHERAQSGIYIFPKSRRPRLPTARDRLLVSGTRYGRTRKRTDNCSANFDMAFVLKGCSTATLPVNSTLTPFSRLKQAPASCKSPMRPSRLVNLSNCSGTVPFQSRNGNVMKGCMTVWSAGSRLFSTHAALRTSDIHNSTILFCYLYVVPVVYVSVNKGA